MKTKRSPRGQSPTPTLSEARLAANRQNARKSTGPRTPEGKVRSSRNATKHGLAAAARDQPSLEKITTLAAALAEDSTDWDVRAYAHSVAEAELDLQQVREARVREHEAAGPGFSSKERSPAGWVLRLFRLERYERRAFSRRKRAIRGLEAAKAGPRPGTPLVELGRRVVAEFWQNEASAAACDISGENWQDEANGTAGEVWRNEPTDAQAYGASDRNRQNEATGAFSENWRNEPTVPTAVWPNEATEPSAGGATRQAGGPKAGAAPRGAPRAPAIRSDPPALRDTAPQVPATGPPRCRNSK